MQTPRTIFLDALRTERARRDFGDHDEQWIQVAIPSDALWDTLSTRVVLLGDREHAEIAVYYDGFGLYYSCVEAAIADIPRYFLTADDPQ